MTDETAHRETVAAILTAGILSGVAKSTTASRALAVYHDVLTALTPSAAPVIDQPSEPAAHSTGSDQRVNWITP